jgi:N utilization substance protein A
VSVLMGYGMAEELAGRLAEAGVGTIDALGSMTPEQLQEIPGIDPEMVENIRDSVTAYYAQFEEAAPAAAVEATAEQESQAAEEFSAEGAPAPEVAAETGEESAAGVREAQDIEIASESDTIIDSGRVSHDESEDGGSQSK